MPLFQYAVLREEKTDKDGEVTSPEELVVDLTTIVASDINVAQLRAARSIPADYDHLLDELELVIRPF